MVLVVGEQVRERDDGDGRLQRGGVAASRRNAALVKCRAQPVRANRPVDVLQMAVAEILDVGIQGVAEKVAELRSRNGLATFRQRADASCEVDADAVDVGHPVKDLRRVQPCSKREPLSIDERGASSCHPAVHLGRSGHRFRRGLEFGHQTVAQVLDETPVESRQRGFLDVVRERLPALDHAGLVLLHEANRLDEVDDEDDGVATGQAYPDVRHRIIRAWRHIPLPGLGFLRSPHASFVPNHSCPTSGRRPPRMPMGGRTGPTISSPGPRGTRFQREEQPRLRLAFQRVQVTASESQRSVRDKVLDGGRHQDLAPGGPRPAGRP